MKRTITQLCVVILLFVSTLVEAQFAGGDGTIENPWQVTTIEQLNSVRDYRDGNFILTADLDFEGSVYESNWLPIGHNYSSQFNGTFNGGGHTIANMKVNRTIQYCGLFGYVKNASISNVALTNCDVTSTESFSGGLAGYFWTCEVENCFVTGKVKGNYKVGGLVGDVYDATITNCYVIADVTGNSLVGGFFGYCDYSVINKGFIVCSVKGLNRSGNVLGEVANTTVSNFYFNSDIALESNAVGANLDASSVSALALTTAEMKSVGSFSGFDFTTDWIISEGTSFPRLKTLYNNVALLSNQFQTKVNVVFTATIDFVNMDYSATAFTLESAPSGLVLTGNQVSWTPTNVGVYEFTISAKDENGVECKKTYSIGVDNYVGEGTEISPFQITSIGDLHNIRYFLDKYYILTQDLDFNGSQYDKSNSAEGWLPIGNNENVFSGSIDGNGHIINNLYINRPSTRNCGLFGYLYSAQLNDLAVVNCDIVGNSYLGSLSGNMQYSNVARCYFTGHLTSSNSYVGLLCGYTGSSTIEDCYAIGDVTANSYVGGFLGLSSSSDISNCYVSASVVGKSQYDGGFIGYCNNSTLENVYLNNFYQNRGAALGYVNNTASATELLYTQMKSAANFSGFDFTNDWIITEETSFPRLRSLFDFPAILFENLNVKVNNEFQESLTSVAMDNETLSFTMLDAPDGAQIVGDVVTWTPSVVGTYDVMFQVEDATGAKSNQVMRIDVVPFDGKGTKANPFQISTIEALNAVRHFLDKNYVLTTDLDFSGSAYDSINSETGWVPLGTNDDPFTGTFNGAGHQISGLYINDNISYTGLFGSVVNASVSNLALTNCYLDCGTNSGVICGYVNNSTISNSYVSGSIKGGNTVGGIAGMLDYGEIQNCYSVCDVSGVNRIGGILGSNYRGNISHTYAVGLINGLTDIGALVGRNFYSSLITDSYYNSDISSLEGVGLDYANQTVTGLSTSEMKESSNFNNYDFTNDWIQVNGTSFPCLRTVYDNPVLLSKSLSGKVNNAASWAIETVSMENTSLTSVLISGPEGLTLSNNTFLWMPDVIGNYEVTVKVTDGSGASSFKKYALSVVPFNGDGTEEDPYEVTSIADLNNVRQFLDKHFVLVDDLDFAGSAYDSINSEIGWEPISTFKGSFNGKGHTIDNLYINRPNNPSATGLFGYSSSAKFDSISVANATIVGSDYVGALIGFSTSSEVNECSATGEIRGRNNVGGLLGVFNISQISNSYYSGDVSGKGFVGGFIGNVYDSDLSACFSAANENGYSNTGAFIGYCNYNTTIEYCYYNKEIAIGVDGFGYNVANQTVTGLSSNEMMQETSFAGFNFAAPWRISEGSTYPRLRGLYNKPLVFASNISIKTGVELSEVINVIPMDNAVSSMVLQGAPEGMTLVNGSIVWTPSEVGEYNFQVKVADSNSEIAYRNFIVSVVPFEGKGDLSDPFKIYTIADLDKIRDYLSYDFELVNDLDFSGSAYDSINSDKGWLPIGENSNQFKGRFNGAGHGIKNLFIDRAELNYVGLFGVCNNAQIDSLALPNCWVRGYNYTSGLIGSSYSTNVTKCYVNGHVEGYDYVGALCGTQDRGLITDCYAAGILNGHNYIGGLIGNSYFATVTSCYSTCSFANGSSSTGIFIGLVSSNIILNNCYYNADSGVSGIASNQSSSQTVGALSNQEFKKETSFNGFDFESVWDIDEGVSFPKLRCANNIPIVVNSSFSATQNVELQDTLKVILMDYDNLSITIMDGPEELVLSNDTIITWTPTENGTSTLKLSVNCGEEYSSYRDISINVFPYNGSGTVEDPFQITNLDQLNNIRNYLDKHFILANDLDFNGSAFDNEHSTSGWISIGNYSNRFTGSLNGNGHVISNLYINKSGSSYQGLFGYTSGAEIDSLTLLNVNVRGYDRVGGIVGYGSNTFISNCHVSGKLSGKNYIGGVLGYATSCTIEECYTATTIAGINELGGLIGYASSSSINESYTVSSVQPSKNSGALIGEVSSSSISNCFYNSELVHNEIGSLGRSDAKHMITGLSTNNMKSSGSFTGFDFSDTWIQTEAITFPRLRATVNPPLILSSSYSTKIGNLYKDTVEVVVMDEVDLSFVKVSAPNGLVLIDSVFTWQIGNDLGLNTFDIKVEAGAYSISKSLSIGVVTFQGAGTVSDPFQITTIEQLAQMGDFLDKHFILMNNLDFEGTDYDPDIKDAYWSPIGNLYTPFNGSFDGNGYSISNFYISKGSTSNVGLFGCINSATIKNLTLLDVDVLGYDYVGAVLGQAALSTITNCAVNGVVKGRYLNVGGVAGYGYYSSIGNCYASGKVVGKERVGGVVGYLDVSELKECYAVNKVVGEIMISAVYGSSFNSDIANCYYNNAINSIYSSSSYTELTALSTSEMKMETSFAGFDFDDVWVISEGNSFPRLRSAYNAPVIAVGSINVKVNEQLNQTVTSIVMDNSSVALSIFDAPTGVELIGSNLKWSPSAVGAYEMILEATDGAGFTTHQMVTLNAIPFEGKGTSEAPFKISTIEELNSIRLFPNSYYRLMNDLDFAGTSYSKESNGLGWDPIGTSTNLFSGSFDGNGYVISNLYVNRNQDNVGLFGCVNDLVIKDLGLAGADITGRAYCGVLFGKCYNSTQTNCYALGRVVGINYVGLLGGYSSEGISSNCYTIGSVKSSSNYAGGFIGFQNSNTTVSNCYSSCSVQGNSYCGAFIGYSNRSTNENCYFNKDATGSLNGVGYSYLGINSVSGATTNQMKQQTTYGGFNFSSIWEIREENTFPALKAMDDAPFAFSDNNVSKPAQFLLNDYDYETLQANLVYAIDTVKSLVTDLVEINSFSHVIANDNLRIRYRAGEVRALQQDTLWGNYAVSFLQVEGSGPSITSVSSGLSTLEDVRFTFTMDHVVASDPDGDDLMPVLIDGANYSVNQSTIIPDKDFNGALTVGVKVSDGIFSSDIIYATVNVTSVNDAPLLMSVDNNLTIDRNSSLTLSLDNVSATDVDSEDLELVLSAGEHYTINSDGVTITPQAGYLGLLSVTISVTDGDEVSNTIDASINVISPNPPVLSSVATGLTIQEDHSLLLSLDNVTATDADGDQLTLIVSPASNYTVATDGLTITPVLNYNGTINVPVAVSDGSQTTETLQMAITVTPVNDAPVLSSVLTNISIDEDKNYTYSMDALSASDADNDQLQLVIGAGDNYTIGSDGVTIIPTSNYYGSLSVSVNVYDGNASSESLTSVINVASVEDVPVLNSVSSSLSVNEDEELIITLDLLSATDGDDDALTIVLSDGDNYSIASDGVTVVPDADFNGRINVGVLVSDGKANSNTLSAAIYVKPVNDKPILSGVTSGLKIPKNSSLGYVIDYLTVSDIDNDNLSVALLTGENYTISTDGTSIIPNVDFTGSLLVELSAFDGVAYSETLTAEVIVLAANAAPALVSVSNDLTVQEDSSIKITLADVVASDADDNVIRLLAHSGSYYTILDDGVTVKPFSDYNGTISVPVSVNDGSLTSEQMLMEITVTPVNDAPIITSVASTAATSGVEYRYELNVTDIDNSSFTYILYNKPSGMEVNEEGTITWTPQNGVVTSGLVTVIVNDGLSWASETFTITVSPLTGFVEVTQENIKIYPNPVQSILTVNSESLMTRVQLVSTSGESVFDLKTSSQSLQIDFHPYGLGVYMLIVETENGTIINKVIRE